MKYVLAIELALDWFLELRRRAAGRTDGRGPGAGSPAGCFFLLSPPSRAKNRPWPFSRSMIPPREEGF